MKLLKTISIILCIFTSYSILAEEEGIDLEKEYISIYENTHNSDFQFYKELTTINPEYYEGVSVLQYLEKKSLLELCNKVDFFHSEEEYKDYKEKLTIIYGELAANAYLFILQNELLAKKKKYPKDKFMREYYLKKVDEAYDKYHFLETNYEDKDFQSKFQKTKEKLWKSCDLNINDIKKMYYTELDLINLIIS